MSTELFHWLVVGGLALIVFALARMSSQLEAIWEEIMAIRKGSDIPSPAELRERDVDREMQQRELGIYKPKDIS